MVFFAGFPGVGVFIGYGIGLTIMGLDVQQVVIEPPALLVAIVPLSVLMSTLGYRFMANKAQPAEAEAEHARASARCRTLERQAVDAQLRSPLANAEPAPPLAQLLATLSARLASALAAGFLRWIRSSKRAADGELTEQIAVANALYFQADDKYTCVHARRGRDVREWLIRVPLSDLATQLNPDDFQQVHRSAIVNMNAVAGTRRDLAGTLYVRIRDHEPPVARPYAGLFRQM